MKKIVLSFVLAAVCCLYSFADIKLPRIFGDSMVLQRDKPVAIWGWASANENVTVQFHQQRKTTVANADGKWKLMLDAETAGGPYVLTVSGKNSISLKGILMGDVWVCSGQSNMEMAIKHCDSAALEIQTANYPEIRHFYLPKDVSGTPREDLRYESRWKPASPANAADFTAVGFFFARALYQQLHIPIGLLHTSWGGTEVETWTSTEGFNTSEDFKWAAALPKLNIDSQIAAKKAGFDKMINDVQGKLPEASAIASWKDPAYNDNAWPKMALPSVWEEKQLKNFDGIVWFRKTITVKKADAGKAAILKVGMIDDSDETYVNGTLAGSAKNQATAKRAYNIPEGILKEGKNVIAIRVDDQWGNGGITGEKADMVLEAKSGSQPLDGDWAFQIESISDQAFNVNPNGYPSLLYNAMVNPVVQFSIKGAIWYQGESNANRAYEYRKSFPLMIRDWRNRFNQGDFPFYFVQLSSFNWANGNNSNVGSTWGELREAQTMTLALPNTGMAVTYDIGNTTDIHPHNKQDVGKRLASVALHDTYDKPVIHAGPTYETMKADGNKINIILSQTHTGLMAKDKYGYVKGFEIAGADKKFYYARALMDGHRIVVSCDSVTNPVAVRYAWADDAGEANLYNKEGFPTAPFRTDNWKGITEDKKYKVNR